ncbi:MAG: hypothetical protein JWO30_968 [Fibrobacteres bacterium]|nr:hypothetical protein [Fibrobacterota bacterium]
MNQTPSDAVTVEIKEISLHFFVSVFFRNLKVIALSVIVCSALAFAYCHYAPKTYISSVTLMPEEHSQEPLGALGMLSSSIGLPVSGSSQFSDMYRDVIKSRLFVRNLLGRQVKAGDSTTTPAGFFGLTNLEERRQVAQLAKVLDKSVDLTKLPNGMMIINLETEDANFSASFLNALISDLEKFFKDKERAKLVSSLEFMKNKIDEKEKIYRTSSNRVAEFISSNQYLDFQKTPHLYSQLEELKRDQRIQEEIYLLLVKEYEKSQIEKEKEKNLIQVLDYAEPAFHKEKPYRVKIMGIAVLGSLLVSYGALVILARLKSQA